MQEEVAVRPGVGEPQAQPGLRIKPQTRSTDSPVDAPGSTAIRGLQKVLARYFHLRFYTDGTEGLLQRSSILFRLLRNDTESRRGDLRDALAVADEVIHG